MTTKERYRASVARARSARQRFLSNTAVAKVRFAPDSLKAEAKAATSRAMDGAKAELRATAAAHPVAIGAGASALFILIFRKPLAALSRRLYVSLRDRRTAEPEPAELEPPEPAEPEPEESHEQGHP